MVTTENTDNARDSLRLADIMRVRIRKADSVLNGALIGAGSAVATGAVRVHPDRAMGQLSR